MHAKDWFLVFIGLFLPPLPVFVKRGYDNADFWINILLFILGYFPGLIHSYYIILCYPYEERYVSLGGSTGHGRPNSYGATIG